MFNMIDNTAVIIIVLATSPLHTVKQTTYQNKQNSDIKSAHAVGDLHQVSLNEGQCNSFE